MLQAALSLEVCLLCWCFVEEVCDNTVDGSGRLWEESCHKRGTCMMNECNPGTDREGSLPTGGGVVVEVASCASVPSVPLRTTKTPMLARTFVCPTVARVVDMIIIQTMDGDDPRQRALLVV